MSDDAETEEQKPSRPARATWEKAKLGAGAVAAALVIVFAAAISLRMLRWALLDGTRWTATRTSSTVIVPTTTAPAITTPTALPEPVPTTPAPTSAAVPTSSPASAAPNLAALVAQCRTRHSGTDMSDTGGTYWSVRECERWARSIMGAMT